MQIINIIVVYFLSYRTKFEDILLHQIFLFVLLLHSLCGHPCLQTLRIIFKQLLSVIFKLILTVIENLTNAVLSEPGDFLMHDIMFKSSSANFALPFLTSVNKVTLTG